MKSLSGEQRKVFKQAVKLSRGLYKNNFPELFSGGKHRLEIPIDNIDYTGSKSYKLIKNYLSENKYKIKDYVGGYAVKEGDKNTYKIGKIISKNKYLSNHFRDCVYRQKFKFVISRHPYDLACSSWNQDWESCLDWKTGFNNSCIHDMVIANSCMVAYLVSQSSNTVLGRCFVIPYYNYDTGDFWLATSSSPYGLFPKDCLKFLGDWLNKNYNEKYRLPKDGLDVIMRYEFPNDLVYDNCDSRYVRALNIKLMDNKFAVRKMINEKTVEKTLAQFYKKSGSYPDVGLLLKECELWYKYHQSYGRDENVRDMKNMGYLISWLKDEHIDNVEYMKYLNSKKLKLNKRLYKVEKFIGNEDYNDNYEKYINIMIDKIDWKEGKEIWSEYYANDRTKISRDIFAKLV